MKNKLKHNKVKNTGIIFECLIKQITSDLLMQENNNTATILLKRIFNKNSEVLKELQLYKSVFTKTKSINESNANIFIDYLLTEYKKLNKNKLDKEKFNAIKIIRENYDIDKFLNIKVDNYSVYATMFKLFTYTEKLNESLNPIELIENRQHLVDFLTKKETESKISQNSDQDNLLEQFNKLEPESKELAYKVFVDKFNTKYSSQFNNEQKLLIKACLYDNIDNSLKEYVSNKIPILKSKINTIVKENKTDVTLVEKLKEVTKLLDKLTTVKEIKTEHVTALLQLYEIFKQVRNEK